MKKIIFLSSCIKLTGRGKVQVEYANYLIQQGYSTEFAIVDDYGDENVLEKNIPRPIQYLNSYEYRLEQQRIRNERNKNIIKKIKFNLSLHQNYKHVVAQFNEIYSRIKPDIIIDFDTSLRGNINEYDCKSIAWIHMHIGNWLKSESALKRYAKALNRYDKIVCVSDEVKKELDTVDKKLAAKTISIYNPFNFNNIQQLANEEFDENEQQFANEKFLLMVSRLDLTCKDYATLFKAFDIAKENGYDGQLYVVGDGDHRNEILEMRSQMKHKENIQLLGAKTNPYKWMKRCDKFILSSTFEGFGNVLVEALAVNDTVISSDCKAGPDEILESGKIGYLFKVGDFQKLADLMIGAQPISRPMIDASIKRFSSEVIMQQFKNLINE
ncbi:Glycosyltransferase Gtf1 [bioreactor metagenome]|uniref:Glycosyltransferase Gtf1 n=1 Tax=bioreactor metagenome TaxID=1076179 RepID=A0A645ASQ2_9ZZZZ